MAIGRFFESLVVVVLLLLVGAAVLFLAPAAAALFMVQKRYFWMTFCDTQCSFSDVRARGIIPTLSSKH
jgi:hypothetical protein